MKNQPQSNREKFEQWFAGPLLRLGADRDAGLILLMATFPILERYLAEKAGSEANTPPFNAAILNVLPELKNLLNAKVFWNTYRNELLHHAAYTRRSHWLSHDKPIVEMEDQGRVWLNPKLFAERIIAVIRSDFDVFENGIPLPKVSVFASPPISDGTFNTYLGTGVPLRGGK